MHTYKDDIAHRYAAYRPPLHQEILQGSIPNGRTYRKGLDIGCGIGHSSVALLEYCDHIVGIDPNKNMLSYAVTNDRITYHHADIYDERITNGDFDFISMAGSLFYQKSQRMVDRITLLSTDVASWLIYDFDIEMRDIYKTLNIPVYVSDYNHQVDLSGLHCPQWLKEKQKEEKLSFDISIEELNHLLLSDHDVQEFLKNKYDHNMEMMIQKELNRSFQNSGVRLSVITYSALYTKITFN